MNIFKFFDIIFSKAKLDTHDFLNRTEYKNITDPMRKLNIILIIISIGLILTTMFLRDISILDSYPMWTFLIILVVILTIYYPRKCTICDNYMVKVFLVSKTNSPDRHMYYCCDNCRVKTKTTITDGNIVN